MSGIPVAFIEGKLINLSNVSASGVFGIRRNGGV